MDRRDRNSCENAAVSTAWASTPAPDCTAAAATNRVLASSLQFDRAFIRPIRKPHLRSPLKTHHRPLWIIIFAILLASIAIRTKGQGLSDGVGNDSAPEAGGGVTTMQIGDQLVEVERVVTSQNGTRAPEIPAGEPGPQGTVPVSATPKRTSMRPKYAFVSAELAQFDSDPDPDGWTATVMLLGKDDAPVRVRRANARFELMPRIPTHDFTGYVDANVKSITWSVPLKFEADGTATSRLKLRTPIRPLAGWPSTSHPAVGRAGGFYSQRRGIIRHTTPGYDGHTALTDLQHRGGEGQYIGMARFGELKVRISVPGEGVFDAVAPVSLRPSVLVDTRWPYQ